MSATTAIEIPLPRLSDAMEEGTIIRWIKSSGDAVTAGDPIVEIETDKATMEYEAENDGVLETLVDEGETVALGNLIARLLPEGSEVSAQPSAPAAADEPTSPRDSTKAPSAPAPAAGNGASTSNGAASNGERHLATPVARRMARELGIDLGTVPATGRRGQILKADVQAHADRDPGDTPVATPPAGERRRSGAEPAPALPPAAAARREELTRTQRTIARRMVESRQSVPEFEVEVEIEMSACLTLRAQLAEHLDPVPSINDMVVRACALALREHPRVNGSFREDTFELHTQVNVGIAVAAQDALMVAVVPNTDTTPLSAIAVKTRELAAHARSGQITPAEVSGATFTVSNLGMFGVDRFSAIINQPQAAILAVGAVVEKPIVRDGELIAGKIMTATLASDHRILYGADAARFITAVRELLQAPVRLLS